MKFQFQIFMLYMASYANALAISLNASESSPSDFGHYATFHFPELNESIQFFAVGHTGPPSNITLNASQHLSTLQRIWVPKDSLRAQSQERDLSDVCASLTGCVGTAASTTAAGAVAIANLSAAKCNAAAVTVYNYFTANEYANSKRAAYWLYNSAVVPFAINIASTAWGTAFMNGEAGQDDPFPADSTSDQCNATAYDNMARDYAASTLAFCNYIVNTASVAGVPTHFTSGQMLASEAEIDGTVNVAKYNIAFTMGKMQQTCADVGVIWRRSVTRAVRKVLRVE